MKLNLLVCFVFIMSWSALQAGEPADTTAHKKSSEVSEMLLPYHRNTIKFNPTPMLLFAEVRNVTFSYERVIGKNMSASVQLGYLLFPKLVSDSIGGILALSGRSKYGVNVAFDYRYYPGSRNRRPAPDGLYLGAFLSYYGFSFENNFDILHTTVDQQGKFTGKLNIINLGVSIGYQFIFWKRFSLDLLMFGPSLSHYMADLTVGGNLDPDQIQNIDKEVVDKLLARFPLLKSIFSDEKLTFTGSRSSLSVGFRYSIQVGFHF